MRAAVPSPCRLAKRLHERLGRRGSYLTCAGSGWMLYGVGLVVTPTPGTVRGMAVLRSIAPMWLWGLVWILCGMTAASFAFTRTGRDRFGFMAAVCPTFLWAGAYGVAMIRGDFPSAWVSAATWLFAAARLIVVSGWPEPPTTQHRQETAHG